MGSSDKLTLSCDRHSRLGSRVDQFCQSEIDYFDRAVIGHHQIVRLDVTMNESGLVCRSQTVTCLDRDLTRFLPVDLLSTLDKVADAPAADHFHHDVIRVTFFGDVKNRHHVGVIQFSGRACFRKKTLERFRLLRNFRRKDLDRHFPLDHRVEAEIDGGHPALPQLSFDFIFSDAITDFDQAVGRIRLIARLGGDRKRLTTDGGVGVIHRFPEFLQ